LVGKKCPLPNIFIHKKVRKVVLEQKFVWYRRDVDAVSLPSLLPEFKLAIPPSYQSSKSVKTTLELAISHCSRQPVIPSNQSILMPFPPGIKKRI